VCAPGGVLGKADASGYAVCHRIEARSFHLGERTLPLCARCTGMYLGAVLGLVFQASIAPRRAGMPKESLLAVLGLLALAFAVDGINSYLHLFPGAPTLYEPSNLGRLLTGTGMGLAVAFLIYPAFHQTVWKSPDYAPALSGFKPLASAILLGLFIAGLVWLENPLLLFVFALLSALGVLLLLTLIYTVLWLLMLRLDNQVERLTQLYFPLMLGFGTGVLQITLFDLARFLLTGTWDGFTIG